MVGTKPSQFVNAPEAARKRFGSEQDIESIYGIPRATLQRWRFFGKGPRWVKFGRSVRYEFAAVDSWIARQPCGGSTEAR
jgi:predicted DNA-binding transcriptional regulator AlpA